MSGNSISLEKCGTKKTLFDGFTVATFALGSQDLYSWLNGNSEVRMLPVSAVNDPAQVRQLGGFISVNGALAVDCLGQVAADYIGGRQYSGTGGHESYVIGAGEAEGGKSILCLKSTATVGEQRVSTIVSRLPADAMVTTPRHHTDFVVTEYGAVDLSLLTDVDRPQAMIEIAHPDYRDQLQKRTRFIRSAAR